MFFILETFFYIFYFLYKLYSLLDQTILYTNQGSKLDKYVKKKNLTNITYNLSSTHNLNFNLNFLKSPDWYNKILQAFVVSMIILALKLAFIYNILFYKDSYTVSFFNKQIDLVKTFDNYFTIFKFLHIFLFLFFILNISYKLIVKFKKTVAINVDENNVDLFLGNDENNKKVYLNKKGLYQNILITGSIGSGKTSTAICNILDYLLSKNIYGLVLDVKGNFINIAESICFKYNKEVVAISLDSNFLYNPINNPNLSCIQIANNIKKVLTLLSENNNSDSYFLDKTESYIKDFIVLIKVYNEFISFYEIHKLATDKDYLNSKLIQVKNIVISNDYSYEYLFEINTSLSNIKNEYLKLDDRTSSIIRSEITRVTDIFVSNHKIYSKFCSNSKPIDFSLNKVYVLSIDIAKNSKLAKVISTYLKLDFQSYILNNNKCDKFFLCDEYQEFANKEDAHFFSLSREYKCINVLSMQSYSSLINSLNNKTSSSVIIQNLVNKIWFRNDDIYTIEEITKQLGKEEKTRLSVSLNESSKETKYSVFSDKFKNIKSNLNEGYSLNKTYENVLDNNYFSSNLKTFETVCMLSDGINTKLYKKVKFKRWEELNETNLKIIKK